MNVVQKHLKKHTPAVSVSSSSLAPFLKSLNSILSTTPANIPAIKASDKPMAFHEFSVTTPSLPAMDPYYEVDENYEYSGIASDVDDDHRTLLDNTISALLRGVLTIFLGIIQLYLILVLLVKIQCLLTGKIQPLLLMFKLIIRN